MSEEIKIVFEVLDHPSNSKGWARYSAEIDNEPIIRTSTNNVWVGKTAKQAYVKEDTEILVRSQVMLRVGGKGFRREEIDTKEFKVIACRGVDLEIEHKPGSQGQTLRITNAKLKE